jgi:ABC-type transporter Mla subunit MlaD
MAESNALNGIRAGIFVATAVVLALAVTFVLMKVNPFESRNRFAIDFTTADGVAGLNKGSDVRVGGVVTGRVIELEPIIDESAQRLDGIRVHIELSAEVPLYWAADNPQRAKVVRVPSLLGNTASVNFISVGNPPCPRLEPGGAMRAIEGTGMLASLVGPENSEKVRQTLSDVAEMVHWARGQLPEDYRTKVVPVLDNLNTMIAALNKDYGEWRVPIGNTITQASSAVKQANDLLTDNKGRINAAVADAAATLDNTKAITADLRQKSMPALQRLLDKGANAADTLADSLDQVERELASDLPAMRLFLSDAREMAGQLKLAAVEVRHSPWKLLYQPKPGEVAHENLYGAARSFATATEDLRAASASLQQAVSQMPDQFRDDPKFRDQLQGQVAEALARYEAAQRRLADVLDAPASEGGEGR